MLQLTYYNIGLDASGSVSVTLTLPPGLQYVGSTSAVTPSINGQHISWRMAQSNYLGGRQLGVRIRTPNAPLGTRYQLAIQITPSRNDVDAANNEALVELMLASLTHLPLVARDKDAAMQLDDQEPAIPGSG
jgi:hypothetical protein